jgi:hypothetical protein
MSIEKLEPLIGEWKVEVDLPGAEDVRATTVFEWILGGAFLQQRSEVDHPAAPDALCVIAPNGEDGKRIEGEWQTSSDGQNWQLDFHLGYLKLA